MKKGHSEIWSQNFFGPPKLDAKSRPMQQIVCNQTLLEMELQTPNQPMIADWMAEISLHYNTSQCIIFLFGETWSVKKIMCDQFAKCFTIRVVISNIPWVNAENERSAFSSRRWFKFDKHRQFLRFATLSTPSPVFRMDDDV